MTTTKQYRQAVDQFSDWRWRLNNLYHIVDKQGRKVRFKLNTPQEMFFDEMHYLNVILKARQLGFSTFVAMFMLDRCIFKELTACGIIDATLDDAKKKLAKASYAYDLMPEGIKQAVPLTRSSTQTMQWGNQSSMEVGVSHRGGTLQYLHISELGKIAAKFPERAKEVRTGALNTIAHGQVVFVESTAEGQDGDFYKMCQTAEEKKILGRDLTKADFKFHFYPWHLMPEYCLDDYETEMVPIPDEYRRYFEELETRDGITLSPGQKAWYAQTAEKQRDEMKREYPSTAKEAFEASIEGAIFGPQMEAAAMEGRIGEFEAYPGVPVHTFWDIGRKDYTSIWFVQVLIGEIRVVGFYQHALVGMPHYAEYCFGTEHAKQFFPDITWHTNKQGIFEQRGWTRGEDYFPHDVRVTEWGPDESRIRQLLAVGFNAKIASNLGVHDGINAARAIIPKCRFHEEGCGEGLKVLKNYRFEWNEQTGSWKNEPRHDDNSHGSDAFRYFATSYPHIEPFTEIPDRKQEPSVIGVGDGKIRLNTTPRDFIEQKKRQMAANGIR